MTEGVVAGHHRVVTAEGGAVQMAEGVVCESIPTSDATEKVMIEKLAKGLADKVKRDGVDAGVDVAETEPDDAKRVPVLVVVAVRLGIEVEPQHERVVRQETDDKYYDKR